MIDIKDIENKIINADCLEFMQNIPDKSIDCIICDLPYGTTACSWDVVIPFDKLWEQYKRIRKDNTPIVLFGSQPFTTMLIASNIKEFRESLVWLKNKPASGFRCKQVHMKIHEDIVVFSNNANYTFNPQKWLISEKEFITQRRNFNAVEVGNNIYGKITRVRKVDTGERNPLSVVSCKVPFTPQNNKDYSTDIDLRIHPTQKPVKLLEYLIKTYSNEGDLILDNCSGSGTLAVACHNLKRRFICIEKDKDYYDASVERLKNAQAQMRLF